MTGVLDYHVQRTPSNVDVRSWDQSKCLNQRGGLISGVQIRGCSLYIIIVLQTSKIFPESLLLQTSLQSARLVRWWTSAGITARRRASRGSRERTLPASRSAAPLPASAPQDYSSSETAAWTPDYATSSSPVSWRHRALSCDCHVTLSLMCVYPDPPAIDPLPIVVSKHDASTKAYLTLYNTLLWNGLDALYPCKCNKNRQNQVLQIAQSHYLQILHFVLWPIIWLIQCSVPVSNH